MVVREVETKRASGFVGRVFSDGKEQGEYQPRSGYLTDFLAQEFLSPYLSANPEHYRELPNIVEEIMAPLIHAGENIAESPWILYGSVPRFMVSKPSKFWEYADYFQKRWSQAADATDSRVRSTWQDLAQGPRDVDMKVRLAAGTSMLSLARSIAQRFNIDNFTTEQFGPQDGSQLYTRGSFQFQFNENFLVSVSAGTIKTNYSRTNMTVSIIRVDNGESVLRVDIGELSADIQRALGDKRAGLTSDWQDLVIAHLGSVDGRLQYQMASNIEKVISGPDAIVTEAEELGDVLEVSLRALRINLLHSKRWYDLGMLMPQFTGESLFNLHRKAVNLILLGKQIAPHVVPLLRKELALCLTINPFYTIQFLHDSGLADAIPGLQGISGERWKEILRSKYLLGGVFDVESRQNIVSGVDTGFINREAEAYSRGVDYDGVERFMWSINDKNKGGEWEAFMKLWEYPAKVSGLVYALPDKPLDVPETHRPAVAIPLRGFPGSSVILMIDRRDIPLTEQAIHDIAVEMQQITSPAAFTAEKMARAEAIIVKTSKYLTFRRELLRDLRRLDRVTEKNEKEESFLIEQLKSIALLYLLFEKFPSGFTPKQMEEVYLHMPTEFEKADFATAFLGFKRTSLLYRDERQRITDVHRNMVPVEIYSLYPRNHQPHALLDIIRQSDFARIYNLVRQIRLGESHELLLDQKQIKRVVNNHLVRQPIGAGISTLETLETITDRDLQLLALEPRRTASETLWRTLKEVRTACRWYFWQALCSGDEVPTVYASGFFDSLSGKEEIKAYARYKDSLEK